MKTSDERSGSPRAGDTVRRHRLSTRLWHWINAGVIFVMLGSGLMIFNAHPRLYWGNYGANPDPAWLEIGATAQTGYLTVAGHSVETTGVLGRWTDSGGTVRTRAFPGWATIPSTYNLALARRWHLTFAWAFAGALLLYALRSLWNGHTRRDLLPTREELRPAHVWTDIKHHATLRFPTGAAALRYNILQKLAYLAVLVVLLPGMVLTGLTLSPAATALMPWLIDVFGGRQSARSLHFIFMALLVGFFIVHMIMVLLAGPINEVRSMITGRFRLPQEKRQ